MTLDPDQFKERRAGRDGMPPSSSNSTLSGNNNKPITSPITIRRRAPGTLNDLGDLTLHSPSTQIIGTPFDSSLKFEYPVPDSNSSSDPASSAESTSSSVHASPTANLLSPPLTSGGSFPFFSASTSSVPYTLPGLIYSDISPSSSSSSSTSSFTPVHPKLKPPADPPIPPSLKKRPRRSLGAGWRKNSFEGQDELYLEAVLRGDHDGILHSRDEGGRAKH